MTRTHGFLQCKASVSLVLRVVRAPRHLRWECKQGPGKLFDTPSISVTHPASPPAPSRESRSDPRRRIALTVASPPYRRRGFQRPPLPVAAVLAWVIVAWVCRATWRFRPPPSIGHRTHRRPGWSRPKPRCDRIPTAPLDLSCWPIVQPDHRTQSASTRRPRRPCRPLVAWRW